jgi:hypothetical protein
MGGRLACRPIYLAADWHAGLHAVVIIPVYEGRKIQNFIIYQ